MLSPKLVFNPSSLSLVRSLALNKILIIVESGKHSGYYRDKRVKLASTAWVPVINVSMGIVTILITT